MAKKGLKIVLIIAALLSAVFVGRLFYEGMRSHNMSKPEVMRNGPEGIQLLPCPSTPNCVCSMEDPSDKEHFLPPVDSPKNPISKVQAIFEDSSRYTIIEVNDTMIRAEFKSKIFRFVDDVIFLYNPETQLLHFRSSSRVGYSDMGANRKRIKAILKQLAEQN